MSNVQQNNSANAGILAYSIIITLLGIGIIVFSVLKDWSAGAYVLGGIFLVAGGSMLVGRMKGGLKYVQLDCPRCGHSQTFAEEALDKGRMVPCKSCDGYMHRDANGVHPVSEDTIADEPIFEAACPAGDFQWPSGCALCGKPHTSVESVEGSTFHVGAVSNKRITMTCNIPVCDEHKGQNAVSIGPGMYIQGDKNFSIRFRSYRACVNFRTLNPTEKRTTTGAAVTFGRQ